MKIQFRIWNISNLYGYVPLIYIQYLQKAIHESHLSPSQVLFKSLLLIPILLTYFLIETWSLSDNNEIRTHNPLVRKRTLNHLAKFYSNFVQRYVSKLVITKVSQLLCHGLIYFYLAMLKRRFAEDFCGR